MPLLDVTVVGGSTGEGLAQRIADACGDALQTEPRRKPRRTWARLRRLPTDDYAENAGADAQPVFVRVLLARWPDDRAAVARALCLAVAGATDRPSEHVHVLFEPPAARCIAFGGSLVRGDADD